MLPATLRTADQLTLRCHCLAEPDNAAAQVVVLHGLGDHGAALPYRHLAAALREHRIAVYSVDHRGHGTSDGPRVYAPRWESLRDDMHRVVMLARERAPERPTFVLGLSMGGLLALDFARRYGAEVRGVIAAAPAVDTSGVPLLVRTLLPLLSTLVPRISIDPGLDLPRIARDAAAVAEYTGDPQFQVRTTPRLAAEIVRAIAENVARAHEVTSPLLVLHGTADTIVPPAGSAHFSSRVASADATRLTYDGAYHNLFLDTVREQVFRDIANWIAARVS